LGPPDAPYLAFISRDLGEIVERVVPDTREGVLNLKSAKQVTHLNTSVDQADEQILESWRTRRVLPPEVVESALSKLGERGCVLVVSR
jgi:CTD kinase subunit gamma